MEKYRLRLVRTSKEETLALDLQFMEEGLLLAARCLGSQIIEPFRRGFGEDYLVLKSAVDADPYLIVAEVTYGIRRSLPDDWRLSIWRWASAAAARGKVPPMCSFSFPEASHAITSPALWTSPSLSLM